MRAFSATIRIAGFVTLVFVAGCQNPPETSSDLLRIDLDRDEPRAFIAYYFGGFMGRDGGDPFDAGLVSEISGEYFLNQPAFAALFEGAQLLSDTNQDGTIDWSELSLFLKQTYYRTRAIPEHIDSLKTKINDEAVFEVSIDGVMTTATRTVRLSEKDLRSALSGYQDASQSIIYPIGAIIIADHILDDHIAESTAMIKRGDGGWDYAVFDSNGFRIPATVTEPKSLAVPTQCVGCHLGKRLYEPEKSFPGAARPGPSGPRRVHWDRPMPSLELVQHFDEHRKRSDGILGLYGTLYVSDLIDSRDRSALTENDLDLLKTLGL